MDACKKICKPESFCLDVESLIVIEISKRIKKKPFQVGGRKGSFSQFIPVNGGIFYFKHKPEDNIELSNIHTDFAARYNSIPEDLILDDYLVDLDKLESKIPRYLEEGIREKDCEKVYLGILQNAETKFCKGVGNLCELIVFEEIRRLEVGELFTNEIVEFNDNYQYGECEVDMILTGRKNMSEKLASGLRSKKYLNFFECVE